MEVPAPSSVDASGWEWIAVADGISRTFASMPGRASYHVVRIDLSVPGLEIYMAPESSGWQKPVSVARRARELSADAAINSVPFHAAHPLLPWSDVMPAGVVYSRGVLVAGPADSYCAAAFFREADGGFRAEIFDSQAELALLSEEPELAVGGFWTILRGGQKASFSGRKDFRSALGTADGGRTIFLLCGKKLSFMDCADILAALGADCAMQFDGGSSCCLFAGGSVLLRGVPSRNVAGALFFAAGGAGK
ncbi:MAG: phosphodiester glycosidase family protein [Treponemataceae bacterium]|nr:phosphodiester glycosidase family protein [Treponemataceae bacterium]